MAASGMIDFKPDTDWRGQDDMLDATPEYSSSEFVHESSCSKGINIHNGKGSIPSLTFSVNIGEIWTIRP